MDILNIDFQSFTPAIIDVLAYLYGDKYRDSIKDKLNKTIFFYFYDLYALTKYVKDFENYQMRKSNLQVLDANYQEIQRVKDYVESEKEREKDVRYFYAKKFCTDIMYLLPQKAQNVLSNLSEEQLVKIFLPPNMYGNTAGDLSEASCFEAFSKENLDKLANREYAFSMMGRATIAKQMSYLECLKKLKISDDDLENYLPNEKQIKQIARTRLAAERDATDNYLITRNDFINFQKSFHTISLDDPLFVIFKKQIQKYQVGEYDACVLDRMYDDDMSSRSIMLYSVKKMGDLFYNLLHECTHICEQRDSYSVGFDIDYTKNKYNSKYRLYERFNETLSDIFTREGLNLLYSNGKFLMESKELTNMNYSSNNTPKENALLLEPLMLNPKYREAIIEVKNGKDPNLFIKLIGKDNFDRLIDALNHVDFLASQPSFKTNQLLQREYELTCIEATSIYQDIDNYVNTRQVMI